MNTKSLNDVLAWNATELPLFDDKGKIETHKAVRRSDNGNLLAIVGNERTIVSNRELVDDIVNVANLFKANIDNCQAYELNKGANLRFRFPIGKLDLKDKHEAFLSFHASHDSTEKKSVAFFVEREVCKNGMRGMTQDIFSFAKFTKNHSGNWKTRFEAFQNGLQGHLQAFRETYLALQSKRVSTQKLNAVLKAVISGTGKRSENARDEIAELFNSGRGNTGSTGSDLLNGITEWMNHFRSYKETSGTSKEENRFRAVEKIDFQSLASLILK